MAALDLTAYNLKSTARFDKAKKEAEEFIARWNAAVVDADPTRGRMQLTAQKKIANSHLRVVKELHAEITDMMFSSGFEIDFKYKTRGMMTTVDMAFMAMTAKQKEMLEAVTRGDPIDMD
jgi:diaminopimelate decarboxylase